MNSMSGALTIECEISDAISIEAKEKEQLMLFVPLKHGSLGGKKFLLRIPTSAALLPDDYRTKLTKGKQVLLRAELGAVLWLFGGSTAKAAAKAAADAPADAAKAAAKAAAQAVAHWAECEKLTRAALVIQHAGTAWVLAGGTLRHGDDYS